MGLYILTRGPDFGLSCEMISGPPEVAKKMAAKMARRHGTMVEVYEARRVAAYDVSEVKD